MHICTRAAALVAAALVVSSFAAPRIVAAQTPAQMEYERQQREYRLQQERQQQEQQRQQQLMNENARRQQEESRRLNAPGAQAPSPSYQRGAPQAAPGRPAAPPADVSARVAPGDFTHEGSSLKGEFDFYAARSTIHRSGGTVRMWEMLDSKTAPIGIHEGRQFYSARNLVEYDCRRSRHRILAASAYEGHTGKGALVGSEVFTPALAWQSIGPDSGYQGLFLKIACAGK